MTASEDPIAAIIEAELNQGLSAAAMAMTEDIRSRHGAGVLACLFYGSCLRDQQDEERVLDFYVLVESYRAFHRGWVAAVANRVLPPNVYYRELDHAGRRIRAKYAVIALTDFRRDVTAAAFLPTLWARMAQPCALSYAGSAEVARQLADALGDAVRTTVRETVGLLPESFTAQELWTRAFLESYRTELRAERPGRAAQLISASVARYDRLSGPALRSLATPDGAGVYVHSADQRHRARARGRWHRRRWLGKGVHVLRLIKNAYTFADGLDYVLWKVARHSGERIEPSAWQRRHPILAAPSLVWRLYRKKAIR